jgi:hypothetical protein
VSSVLAAAIRDLEDTIAIQSEGAPDGAVRLASGGIAEDDDSPPFLCLTREMAVDEWLTAMHDYIVARMGEEGSPFVNMTHEDLCLRWGDEPAMYRYQITMTGDDNTHRVVQDRFAVFCTVWIGTIEESAKLKPARPVLGVSER